jgi:hypothetical protein
MGATTSYAPWAQILIPALAALVGVLIGGLITSHNQRKERQHRRMREQLEGFYSVLLAMRLQIRAKSELREQLRTIAREEWPKVLESGSFGDPQAKEMIFKAKWPQFDKIFEYDERQLEQEIVPLYRKMLTHMTKFMGLAEPSTIKHYGTLVEYVEIWNRAFQQSLPREVRARLQHEERKLYPFYEDLEAQAQQLREKLKK